MQRKTNRFIEDLEFLPVEDGTQIPDLLAPAYRGADEGASAPAFALTPLELAADGPAPFPARKTAGGDFGLGLGGALLFHVLAAIAVLLLPIVQSSPHCRESLVRVYLMEAENAGKGAGAAEITGIGKHPEESPPRGELQGAPDTPVAAQTVQQAPTAADRENPVSPSRARHTPHAARRIAASRISPAAVKESASDKAGVGAALKQGQDTGNGRKTGAVPDKSGLGWPFATGSGAEFEAARIDHAPQVVRKIEPAYPSRARKQGICGKVVVRFLVESDGSVSRPFVVEARPAGYFEQSALEAIRQWRFKPGWFKGRAVSTWVTLPVQFRLIEED
ncbi:MAG: energy transducer TonB [Desulfobacteraceae bacterium]|nr:energy transducer TonB [Desulfobacteraceae bacterium]